MERRGEAKRAYRDIKPFPPYREAGAGSQSEQVAEDIFGIHSTYLCFFTVST